MNCTHLHREVKVTQSEDVGGAGAQVPDSSSSRYPVSQGCEGVTVAMSPVALPRYQFNPAFFQTTVTAQILLKALTNLPHTDFTLCKCMIDQAHVSFQGQRALRQG